MTLNTHTNTAINPLRKHNSISVNLKPTIKELSKLSDMQNAIDTLICQDNFIDNNPMRANDSGVLFWDWVIVTVNGFSIPAPIHTATKKDSVLYTANGREVYLSHQQCAVTTAYFYLYTLMEFSEGWDKVRDLIHPIFVIGLTGGISKVKSLNKKEALKILRTLHDNLCGKGHEVLN